MTETYILAFLPAAVCLGATLAVWINHWQAQREHKQRMEEYKREGE